MALVLNGTTLDETTGNIYFNGALINQVVCDGITVWQKREIAVYNITFSSNSTYTVPATTTGEIYVEMIGGGGSGAKRGTTSGDVGGGQSGSIVKQLINVYAGQVLNIKVGAAGPAQTANDSDGISGGNTSVDNLVASGGQGGSKWGTYHKGVGAFISNAWAYDGNKDTVGSVTAFGGGAGLDTNGGDGSATRNGQPSTNGGGGGATANSSSPSGRGGGGLVKLTVYYYK